MRVRVQWKFLVLGMNYIEERSFRFVSLKMILVGF